MTKANQIAFVLKPEKGPPTAAVNGHAAELLRHELIEEAGMVKLVLVIRLKDSKGA